jgi:hypothetical protein
MDPDKINNIAIKAVGITLAAFLVIGGVGACINHSYPKGITGLIASPIIVFIAFQPASIKTWGIMAVVFFLVMYIVGAIGN